MEKKKDLKKLWNGNGTRTDWIIDDIIDFGSVKPLSEVQRELNGVTLEKVEVVARRIFNPANLRILIAISNKKLSKIESL
jgi:predicted Zn-dependent peptidase